MVPGEVVGPGSPSRSDPRVWPSRETSLEEVPGRTAQHQSPPSRDAHRESLAMSRSNDTQAFLTPPQATATRPPFPADGARRFTFETIKDYASIARPDHWCKNAFMVLGVLLAYFYHPEVLGWATVGRIAWAVLVTCLVASSNYVLNEILDAPTDLEHPTKRFRPIPAGRVLIPAAYAEWLLLGLIGLAMAS